MVWFVECRDDVGTLESQGSAVAIRLKPKENGESETYLLTCLHVIQSRSGKRYPHINAWRPGIGQNEQTKASLTPFLQPSEQFPSADHEDWVVLKFQNRNDAIGSFVGPWKDRPQGKCRIFGYLGDKFDTPGKVEATEFGPFSLKSQDSHYLRLQGADTREGASGGGVFDDAMFAGIHQGKRDEEFRLQGISAQSILRRLDELGYEPVEWRPTELASLTQILAGPSVNENEAIADAYRKSLPQTHDLSMSDYTESLKDSLTRLFGFLAGGDRLRPIDRFAKHLLDDPRLTQSRREELTIWTAEYCAQQPIANLVPQPLPRRKASEPPRLVIRMRNAVNEVDPPFCPFDPSNENASAAEKERYLYEIWFEGFTSSIPMRRYVDCRLHFGKIVASAWDAIKKDQDPGKVWIELSLPRDLLYCWPVEQEQVRIDKYTNTLGVTQHFVLRVEEREYPMSVASRLSEAKRRHNPTGELRGEPFPLHWIPKMIEVPVDCLEKSYIVSVDHDAHPLDAFHQLSQRMGILAAYLHTFSIPFLSNEDSVVLDGVLDSGVPLVMWLRREPSPDQIGLAQRLDQKTLDAVSNEVRTIRREAINPKNGESAIGRDLAVVFDSPARRMPDDPWSGAMVSPHS